jgi:3D (Asp-Asp-Asp) domain-containing protein
MTTILPDPSPTSPAYRCIPGFLITGYYTTDLADYPRDNLAEIIVGGGKRRFNNDFLKQTKIQGWGKIDAELYLGFYKEWYFSPYPLDALGNRLISDTAAADPSVIPYNSIIRIPNLLGNRELKVTDTGGGIQGRHIDIYMGVGNEARQKARNITRKNQVVCVYT